MSAKAEYDPDDVAIPVSLYSTVFLSQRDLQLKVPINFVTEPGVSLSSACFPDLVYEDESFKSCFSNLLAEGFRRFQVDLYWNEVREAWSFCPISISTSLPSVETTSTIFTSSTSLVAEPSDTISSDATATGISLASSIIAERQVTSSPLSRPIIKHQKRGSSIFASLSTTYVEDLPEPALSLPPYICSAEFPKTPAAYPDTLPSPSQLLGSLFSSNLSQYIYTPVNLFSERTDLNSSWYTVPETYRPASGYYTTNVNEYGIFSTENGWPSESYIEFSKSRRLLVGYGSTDPQMERYNFTGDKNTIFPTGFIQSNQTVTFDETGNIASGCFLSPNLTVFGPSEVNSSWATSYLADIISYSLPTSNISRLFNLSTSLTACGISPFLNTPLLNSTAHTNPTLYQNYSHSTIWSWAPGEPKNFSNNDADSDALFRCARTTLYSNGHKYGRWYVDDCSNKNYAACRIPSQPYNWTLTTYQTSYSFSSAACPSPYIFSAPRTALENAYLHQTIEALSHHRPNLAPANNNKGANIWLDFNSIHIKNCWVTGGANATCPYTATGEIESEAQKKIVLIPTVSAIIVLAIGMLTAFVKMGGTANAGVRRGRRRRRWRRMRGESGFYEGVPS